MKICHLGDASVIHTWIRADYMEKIGYETHLISLKPPREDFKNQNVKVHVIPKKNLKNPINLFWTILKIRNLVKKINPDIIDAHYVTHYGFFAAMTGKPFICSAWGSDIVILPKKSKIIKLVTKYTLKKAHAVLCDAYHMAKSLEDLGTNKDKIKIIFYGVDLKKFDLEKLKKEFKRSDATPTVITVRGLEPRYDPETIIKSAPLVLKEFSNAKFAIIGDGSQRQYLDGLAKSLNCHQNIDFLGRKLHEELPRYLVSSDIYVSTSLADGGLGSATAEAMSCELPVVVIDFGDNTKWVEDGKNGFVIPPRDHEKLALKITELLKNNDLREKMGKLNRKIIEERLNLDVEMLKLDKLYRDIVSSSK